MEILVYPSRNFIRRAKVAVRRKHEIKITFQPGWRSRLVLEEFPGILEQTPTDEKRGTWKSLINMFRLLPFLTVYWYAKSGGYAVKYNNETDMYVALKPPRNKSK